VCRDAAKSVRGLPDGRTESWTDKRMLPNAMGKGKPGRGYSRRVIETRLAVLQYWPSAPARQRRHAPDSKKARSAMGAPRRHPRHLGLMPVQETPVRPISTGSGFRAPGLQGYTPDDDSRTWVGPTPALLEVVSPFTVLRPTIAVSSLARWSVRGRDLTTVEDRHGFGLAVSVRHLQSRNFGIRGRSPA